MPLRSVKTMLGTSLHRHAPTLAQAAAVEAEEGRLRYRGPSDGAEVP